MTQEEIRNTRISCQEEIDKCFKRINQIRQQWKDLHKECSHPNIKPYNNWIDECVDCQYIIYRNI